MTRINVVPVQELSAKHLVAEYREITRLPGYLKKSLKRKTKPFSFDEIPPQYVLGSGHVKFFYDKMEFLRLRFNSLVSEMLRRGYSPKYTEDLIFRQCPELFYKNYEPTALAIELNRIRIKERTK